MPDALLIAHGQPSAPEAAEAALALEATKVGALMPGWRIKSATLAMNGALREVAGTLDAPLVLPLFMADGWFTRRLLPTRLAEAGLAGAPVLPPLGLAPGLVAIAINYAREAAQIAGFAPEAGTLILAAHGSATGPAAGKAARAFAQAMLPAGFADQRLGFIEEAPGLADVACDAGPHALCLPLFVARGGHVIDDIPQALDRAGFAGTLLDPIGLHPEVPALIASLLRGAPS
ncbi:MAG: CbiX/SirB N-terminal domain-containing protein [Paracoccaceae bacterium]